MARSGGTLLSARYSIDQLIELRSTLEIVICNISKIKDNALAEIMTLPYQAMMNPEHFSCLSSEMKVPSRPLENSQYSDDEEHIVYKGHPARVGLRQVRWHLRARDSSDGRSGSSQPLSAPTELAAQKAANFKNFYRAVVSPTHVRVTAGGRIVPNNVGLRAPPPQLIWNANATRFDPVHEDKTSSSGDKSQGMAFDFMNGVSAVNRPPSCSFVPDLHDEDPSQSSLAKQSSTDGVLDTNANSRDPVPNSDEKEPEPQKIKISPPTQFDATKPFMYNGQLVYPVSAGFQPPVGFPMLPMNTVGAGGLLQQGSGVPTFNHSPEVTTSVGGYGPRVPYSVPTYLDHQLIPTPFFGDLNTVNPVSSMYPAPPGFMPLTSSIASPFFQDSLPPNVSTASLFIGAGHSRLAALKSQVEHLEGQLKHVDHQLENNRYQINEQHFRDQRLLLRTQIAALKTLINNDRKPSSSSETMSVEASGNSIPLAQQYQLNKRHVKGQNQEMAGKVVDSSSDSVKSSQRNSSVPSGSNASAERTVKSNRLSAAAALAPPFQPRFHSLTGENVAQPSDAANVVSQSASNISTSAEYWPTPKHMRRFVTGSYGQGRAMISYNSYQAGQLSPAAMYPTSFQDAAPKISRTEKEVPHVPNKPKPYLTGYSIPGARMANEREFLYRRPLTTDELQARYLYWGKAPREVSAGLPKFDGKDFYPASPIKSYAIPAGLQSSVATLPGDKVSATEDSDPDVLSEAKAALKSSSRSSTAIGNNIEIEEVDDDTASVNSWGGSKFSTEETNENGEEEELEKWSSKDNSSKIARQATKPSESSTFWRGMLSSTPNTAAPMALTGLPTSVIAHGFLPQYRGAAVASLTPANTGPTDLKMPDLRRRVNIDQPLSTSRNENRPPKNSRAAHDAAEMLRRVDRQNQNRGTSQNAAGWHGPGHGFAW